MVHQIDILLFSWHQAWLYLHFNELLSWDVPDHFDYILQLINIHSPWIGKTIYKGIIIWFLFALSEPRLFTNLLIKIGFPKFYIILTRR